MVGVLRTELGIFLERNEQLIALWIDSDLKDTDINGSLGNGLISIPDTGYTIYLIIGN